LSQVVGRMDTYLERAGDVTTTSSSQTAATDDIALVGTPTGPARAAAPMADAVGLRGRRLAAYMVSAATDTASPSTNDAADGVARRGVTSAPRGVDRVRLAEIMAAIADGDDAAVLRLHQEFYAPMAAVVRVELRRHNVHRIDDDDLHGLVLDVCFALASCAGAWTADGALPWQWARPRVSAAVSAWVGQFAESFDPDRHGGRSSSVAEPWTGNEPSMLELLDQLAQRHPALALLREALARVGSLRDQELLIAYVAQQQSGDTSPAVTLAATFDVSPEVVRQAVSRMRRGLRQLADSDDRFEILHGLALVA
jgi:hypothetical protein